MAQRKTRQLPAHQESARSEKHYNKTVSCNSRRPCPTTGCHELITCHFILSPDERRQACDFQIGSGVSTINVEDWETDATFLYEVLNADGRPSRVISIQGDFGRYNRTKLHESTGQRGSRGRAAGAFFLKADSLGILKHDGYDDEFRHLHHGARMKRTRPIRVCIMGPSPDVVGGQAVQAQRLRTRLARSPELEVTFLPVNPRLTKPLHLLQRVKYVRTIVTTVAYVLSLLRRVPRMDMVHAFSASYWSFLLAPVPAMLVARLFHKGVILNYRSGEADDHLARWRTAAPLMRLAHLIVVPSNYLVDVFARHGLKAKAVPNFVEIEQLPYRQRDTVRPVFLSNRIFQALYNVSCVLRAFGRIQARMPEAKLVVAGDGPLRERLQICFQSNLFCHFGRANNERVILIHSCFHRGNLGVLPKKLN